MAFIRLLAASSFLGSCAAALYLYVVGLGWLGFIFVAGYLGALAFHVYATARVLKDRDPKILLLSVCGSLLFVFGFALQYDGGDSYDWLSYRAAIHGAGNASAQPPDWWLGGLFNPVVLAPWFYVAVRMVQQVKRLQRSGPVDTP